MRNGDDRTTAASGTKTVAAVDRALSLLGSFSRDEPILSLARMAARTGLSKATLLRLAQTLERSGYVRRLGDGSYSLGPATLPLARLYQAVASPEQVIVPVLRHLVEQTSESAGYHVRVREFRMCMYRVDSPLTLRDHIRPGDLLPRDRGAGGRMLAAFEPPIKRSHAAMREALYVVSRGDLEPDMGGVASPVFGENDEMTGVITLSGPATRYHKAAVDRYLPLLLAACRKVTAESGGDVRRFDALLPPPAVANARRRSRAAR